MHQNYLSWRESSNRLSTGAAPPPACQALFWNSPAITTANCQTNFWASSTNPPVSNNQMIHNAGYLPWSAWLHCHNVPSLRHNELAGVETSWSDLRQGRGGADRLWKAHRAVSITTLSPQVGGRTIFGQSQGCTRGMCWECLLSLSSPTAAQATKLPHCSWCQRSLIHLHMIKPSCKA